MKKFVTKRLKQLGIKRAEFMRIIGIKRDVHTKVNTMENKLNDLNEFFNPLECEVIIVLKKQKSVAFKRHIVDLHEEIN